MLAIRHVDEIIIACRGLFRRADWNLHPDTLIPHARQRASVVTDDSGVDKNASILAGRITVLGDSAIASYVRFIEALLCAARQPPLCRGQLYNAGRSSAILPGCDKAATDSARYIHFIGLSCREFAFRGVHIPATFRTIERPGDFTFATSHNTPHREPRDTRRLNLFPRERHHAP